MLAGRTPDDATLPDFTLDDLALPAELPVIVPAKLVRQRPDVQAAEALLHESTAQLGVATANLYPQLNLTGSIGSETLSASDLFRPRHRAPGTSAARCCSRCFTAASCSTKRAARADLDRATAQYRQTVLAALQDVADTLRALEADARTLQADTDHRDATRRTPSSMTKLQFKVGGVSYLSC